MLQTERDKYLWIYQCSGNHSYGKRNHGAGAYQIVLDMDIKSLLDVGCGKGNFVEWAKTQGIEAVGIDWASGYGIEADVCSLPFPDDSFEMITAFDVLEHLEENDLDIALKEMARVASRYWLISIGYGPSRIRGPHNTWLQLHPIATKDKEWWTPHLLKYGKIRKEGATRRGNPYLICTLEKNNGS